MFHWKYNNSGACTHNADGQMAFQELCFAHFQYKAPPLDLLWEGYWPFDGRNICEQPANPAAPNGGEADHDLMDWDFHGG